MSKVFVGVDAWKCSVVNLPSAAEKAALSDPASMSMGDWAQTRRYTEELLTSSADKDVRAVYTKEQRGRIMDNYRGWRHTVTASVARKRFSRRFSGNAGSYRPRRLFWLMSPKGIRPDARTDNGRRQVRQFCGIGAQLIHSKLQCRISELRRIILNRSRSSGWLNFFNNRTLEVIRG